jgi:hypothetical protein
MQSNQRKPSKPRKPRKPNAPTRLFPGCEMKLPTTDIAVDPDSVQLGVDEDGLPIYSNSDLDLDELEFMSIAIDDTDSIEITSQGQLDNLPSESAGELTTKSLRFSRSELQQIIRVLKPQGKLVTRSRTYLRDELVGIIADMKSNGVLKTA